MLKWTINHFNSFLSDSPKSAGFCFTLSPPALQSSVSHVGTKILNSLPSSESTNKCYSTINALKRDPQILSEQPAYGLSDDGGNSNLIAAANLWRAYCVPDTALRAHQCTNSPLDPRGSSQEHFYCANEDEDTETLRYEIT